MAEDEDSAPGGGRESAEPSVVPGLAGTSRPVSIRAEFIPSSAEGAPSLFLADEQTITRLQAALTSGAVGNDPVARLVLACAQAREHWEKEPRVVVRAYLAALWNFFNELGVGLGPWKTLNVPLVSAIAALNDLDQGRKVAPWLRPAPRRKGRAPAGGGTQHLRAISAAAVDWIMQNGSDQTEADRLQVALGKVAKVAGVKKSKVDSWRKGIQRDEHAKNAAGFEERQIYRKFRQKFSEFPETGEDGVLLVVAHLRNMHKEKVDERPF